MSTDILDDASARARIDPSGMLESITRLPDQCRDAWAAAQTFEPPADYSDIDRIAIIGMGGSAIGGDFFRVLLQRESGVPVFNVRGYDLPPFVTEKTLVIASSFSGNTEETLSAFGQALARPCRKLAITSGGKLLATARSNGVPALSYAFKGEPRAAVGWGLMPLLAIGEKLGLMQGVQADVDEMLSVMEAIQKEIGVEAPASGNEAKQVARRLHQKLPVTYGAGSLTEVAHRWKTQLNESSKVWAFYEELPELHHNAIIGYKLPTGIARNTMVVFLRSEDIIHPRVLLRYDFTERLLRDAGVESLSVSTRGKSALAQMMSLILFGDYVSGYLALLYEVDPTPTTVIDELKAWLATQK
jgi:glucose/mannose-6-phosphate isomerase